MTDIKITVMQEVRPATPALPDALLPREQQTYPCPAPDFSNEQLTARPVETHRRAQMEDVLKQRILDMSRRYAAHARWQMLCHAYSTAKAAGEHADLNIRKMPFKKSKYYMYDDAAVVRQLMTDLGYLNVPGRPHSLWAVGEIVRYARQQTGIRALTL